MGFRDPGTLIWLVFGLLLPAVTALLLVLRHL